MEAGAGPSFFKILMDLPSHLGLPRGFTEKYPEILSRRAKLRTASGATWEVSVAKVDEEGRDCYFFTQGWPAFLQQNGLQRFQLLVFSYAGGSTFHVTVYAADACEKGSAPGFQQTMKEYHPYILHVPRHFYEAAGLKGGEKVVFEHGGGGERVEVALNVWKSEGRSFMTVGVEWNEFWVRNKLSVGKTYSFEFLPRKKVILVKHYISNY